MGNGLSCAGCGALAPTGAAFCPTCGDRLGRACANCGASVEASHQFCPACGRRLQQATAEERKLITAVFVDLVGSTDLGEQLDPEVLRLILSRYFEAMASIVESWGGTVAKYVGDAVLAVFGAPRSRGDDADRALHAALAMRERLAALNGRFHAEYGVRLTTRTGINTGDVVVSGSDEVVLGDVMNTAARLEQAAGPGSILVGARTVANLVTPFQMLGEQHIPAKGKSEPVTAHVLIGPPTGRSRRTVTDLVGRERPLELLTTHLGQVIDGSTPLLVAVIGEAGIGKSTVVATFSQRCEQRGVRVLQGGCLPYGEGIASWPLREIIHGLAGIDLSDDGVSVAARFRAFVQSISDDETMLHAIALGAGISVGENPLTRAPAEVVRRELARAWPQLLTSLAVSSPVLLVVEDVHWADDELISMFDRIVLSASGPVMVLVTARPDFDEMGFGTRSPWARISITPLDDADRSTMVERLVPGLEGSDVDAVVSAAGGNPFFIEEIVAHLIESGALRDIDGRFERVRDLDRQTVPDTIRALLGARIDGLEPVAKEVLLAASVVGTNFWVEALAHILPGVDLDGAIDVLEVEGFVVPESEGRLTGQRHLGFRHHLLRDVAYASVSRARAARYHAAVADWIEGRTGDRRHEFLDLIAHHRSQAADGRSLAWPDEREMRESVRRSAIDDLLAASGAALGRSAWEDAFRFIERAEALAESVEERARARLERARSRRALDRYSAAWLDYQELISLADAEGLDAVRRDAVIEGAIMTAQMGGAIDEVHDWRRWLASLVAGRLHAALTGGAPEEAAALLMAKSSLFFWQVEGATAEESLEAATRAVELAETCGSDRVKGPAMDLLAGVTMMSRGLGDALLLVDQVLEVADSAPDRVVANELYTTAQWTLAAAGELGRARSVADRHLAEANLLGAHTRVHSHRGVVELALALGDLTAVIEGTESLLGIIEEDGGRVCDHGAVALSARALALVEAGNESGLALFDEVEERAVPRAQFTAHIGALERKRPFVPLLELRAALDVLEEARYAGQSVARCWVAVPLALRLEDGEWLDAEIGRARLLGSETRDPAVETLAEWAEAVADAGYGSPSASDRVWRAVSRLEDLGHAYTGRRLGVDACWVLPEPPAWGGVLAARLRDGGAHRSAEELRGLLGG